MSIKVATCPTCGAVHSINPSTGEIAGHLDVVGDLCLGNTPVFSEIEDLKKDLKVEKRGRYLVVTHQGEIYMTGELPLHEMYQAEIVVDLVDDRILKNRRGSNGPIEMRHAPAPSRSYKVLSTPLDIPQRRGTWDV